MALMKGINSYATVVEAETYFADRLNVATWVAADEITKAQALVTATAMLDNLDWSGGAVSSSQVLAFPRNSEYFDPRLGINVTSSNIVPNRIFLASIELAYHLLNNTDLLDSTGGVHSLNIGGISLDTIRTAPKLPMIVKKLIRPLLLNTAAVNSWWRSN